MPFPSTDGAPAPAQYARVNQLDSNSRNGIYYLADANAGGGNPNPPASTFSQVGTIPIKAG